MGQPLKVESANTDVKQPVNTEPADIDAESESGEKHVSSSDSDISDKEETVVTAIFAHGENNTNPPEISEQALRSDTSRNNNIVIAAGIAAGIAVLSVIAGAAGFCVHSLSGTKR